MPFETADCNQYLTNLTDGGSEGGLKAAQTDSRLSGVNAKDDYKQKLHAAKTLAGLPAGVGTGGKTPGCWSRREPSITYHRPGSGSSAPAPEVKAATRAAARTRRRSVGIMAERVYTGESALTR